MLKALQFAAVLPLDPDKYPQKPAPQIPRTWHEVLDEVYPADNPITRQSTQHPALSRFWDTET